METAQKLHILSALPFLRDARPPVLEQLAQALIERCYEPGQAIVVEGQSGRDMYLVLEGEVQILKEFFGEEMLLTTRGPGNLFGEMALFDGSPRSATVRAAGVVHILEIPAAAMNALLAEQPELLLHTVQALSARLRQSDLQMITDLQLKNQELARAYHDLKEAQDALVEKERMERELELARDLQQSILPRQFPRIPGFECAARSIPARHVGGDFYDVIDLGEGKIGLVMADVSDKGMSAALFMALTRSLLRAEARRDPSPLRVLTSVNDLIMEMSQTSMFVTVFYGILDVHSGLLRYARAGHDYPLLYNTQDCTCRLLKGRGAPLGLMQPPILEEIELQIEPGNWLVLYTDGVTDMNSPSGEFFDRERLVEAVCTVSRSKEGLAPALSPQELCDALFERLKNFQAGAVQYDDMAILVVKVG